MTPVQQLASFLAKYDPAIAATAMKVRAAFRKRMPTALELVYDNYNALVIGYGPNERASDAILSIALYPKYVTVFFLQGAGLADPDGLLSGSGKLVRNLRLESAAAIAQPGVRALIDRAIEGARVALPRTGRGKLIIRSVSPRQRPRRPAAKKKATRKRTR